MSHGHGHGHHHNHNHNQDVDWFKTSMVASMIFGATVIFGLVPLAIKNFDRIKGVYGFIDIFICGINLGNICYDVIPEMNGECPKNRSPSSLIGIIIIALIAIESIFVKDHSHSHGHHHHSHEHSSSTAHKHSSDLSNVECTVKQEDTEDNATHDHSHSKENKKCTTSSENKNEEEDLGQHHLAYINEAKSLANIAIFLFAISLHSILEGLDTHCTTYFSSHIFGLLLHKATEGFTVGIALFKSKIKKSYSIIAIIIYSLLTPISIFIGIAITSANKSVGLWFKSLALGSLLYVVFLEGMSHSLHGKTKYLKLVFLLLGYLISLLSVELAHQ